MLAGIREILIISTPIDLPNFKRLLGDGSELGIKLFYKEQPSPDGLAQAFIIGEDFIGDDDVCLTLGDNIFYGQGLIKILEKSIENLDDNKATVFGYYVNGPKRFGVVDFDKSGNAERGYFFESFKQDDLNDFLGFDVNFCQDNESKSTYGVLRGLHYQESPFAQAKLVRVIQGSVLDVAVDIRKDSLTFGKHVVIELNDKNKKQLFIPRGFAHGFVTLSETAVFSYKVDNYYSREFDRGIAFDDTRLGINWKVKYENLQISLKDKAQPFLNNKNVLQIKSL